MKESLEDYTRVMRGRYARRTGKQARSALLDEYCRSSGLERKHVIKVLRGQRRRGATGAARELAAPMAARTSPCSKPCGWSQDNPVANVWPERCCASGWPPGKSTMAR